MATEWSFFLRILDFYDFEATSTPAPYARLEPYTAHAYLRWADATCAGEIVAEVFNPRSAEASHVFG